MAAPDNATVFAVVDVGLGVVDHGAAAGSAGSVVVCVCVCVCVCMREREREWLRLTL